MQTCGTNFLLIQEADDLEIILNYREVIRIYSFSGIISFSKKKKKKNICYETNKAVDH